MQLCSMVECRALHFFFPFREGYLIAAINTVACKTPNMYIQNFVQIKSYKKIKVENKFI